MALNPISVPRREHMGGASPATLAQAITASDLAITGDDLTGWPTGAMGPFVATLGRGLPMEERILCQSRNGNAITVAQRGWDGTAPIDHAVNETLEHTDSATEFDEANIHITATSAHGIDMAAIPIENVSGLQESLDNRYTKEQADSTFVNAGELIPPGMIMPTARPDVPAGWLVCDGRNLPQASYPALFAAIGNIFNTAAPVGTFNLPNLKGRVVVMIDTAQTEFVSRGKTGGAKTAALSVTHMPAHNHGATSANGAAQEDITATFSVNDGVQGPIPVPPHPIRTGQVGVGRFSAKIEGLVGTNHTHTIPAQGSNTAFSIMPPYLSLNYLIKT